ncbi:MAG TPA: DUF2461 domain-containing protein [Gemmatimonadaceae bacterium]|nr:DUF2461 domain-containing protein [Gemmatimonadaceae bacterium]
MRRATSPTGEFPGFRPAARTFLRGLRRNNNREWFLANRERYDAEVRGPMAALVEELDVRLAAIAPEIVGDPKRSMFRIHRDVRFSNDKSPYKTNVACWLYHMDAGRGVGGDAAHGGAGFYFDIGPDESWVGGGIWMPPRPTLARLRERIDEEHESLTTILRAPALKPFGGLAREAMLTRMPRGYDADHPAAELLRHQSFTMGRQVRDADLYSARLPDLLARELVRLVPLVRWLNGALGLRTLARR